MPSNVEHAGTGQASAEAGGELSAVLFRLGGSRRPRRLGEPPLDASPDSSLAAPSSWSYEDGSGCARLTTGVSSLLSTGREVGTGSARAGSASSGAESSSSGVSAGSSDD